MLSHGSWREKYDAVLCDLDGTLYHAGPVKVAMALELLCFGARVVPLLRAFRKQHEIVRQVTHIEAESPYHYQLKLTASALDIDVASVERGVSLWMSERPVRWLRRFARTELIRDLVRFQQRGGKLGLVSDYPARQKLRAFDDIVRFDVIVASGEQGGPSSLKPNPDGYERAARQLVVAADRCLVLGDRDDADGAAARALGMAFERIG
jgi:HAD superfamily hydrolase (TIGR01549 family)